jgi:hypothetical protein
MLVPKAPSPPLQLETDRATLSEDVASRSNTRLLWTGFGFAVLLLMGLSAYVLLSLASHALIGTLYVPVVAFIPSQSVPSRTTKTTPRGVNDRRSWFSPFATPPAIRDILEREDLAGEDLGEENKDQKMTWARDWQPPVWHPPGKMSGSRRSPLPVMYWLDSPVPAYSQSAILDLPVPMLQRKTAPAPTRPPPLLPPKLVGTDVEGEAYLRRYSDSEAVTILDEWIDRVKVHCMGFQFGDPDGLAPVYRATLQQLESFRSFAFLGRDRWRTPSKSKAGAPEEKVLYGLYNEKDNNNVRGHSKQAVKSKHPISRDLHPQVRCIYE